MVPLKPNFRPVLINIHSESRIQRIAFENTVLQIMAKKHRLDCMHWFANTQAVINATPGVVTIYDLQAFKNLVKFNLFKQAYLHLMMKLTIKKAPLLLPISQSTAQELRSMFHVHPHRMKIIPIILGLQFKPADKKKIMSFRTKYKLPEKFWLYVAHFYPHKNHIRLLQSYHELKSKSLHPWPLVLRGDPKGSEMDIKEWINLLNLKRDIIMLPKLDEEALSTLYSAATALIFPSLYEGCGLPIVEAMACGCPIIASNIPVIKEFASDSAYYFDPLDVDAIRKSMMTFQNNIELREHFKQMGLVRAKNFRGNVIIDKLLSAYREVIQR